MNQIKKWSNWFKSVKGPSINYVVSRGEGGGQKLPILLSKKTTKRGGGGQKLPILRRHSLWTAPNYALSLTKVKVRPSFIMPLGKILEKQPTNFA